MEALAYYNWGRWVTDCPRWPACTSALAVQPGQQSAQCDPGEGCGLPYEIAWPPAPDAIAAALASRPEKRRNWFPTGHPRAVATGQPHGQTVAELHAEEQAMAAQEAAAEHLQLAEVLAGFGFHLGGPDGMTLERG